MASLSLRSFSSSAEPRAAERRVAGAAVTILVHVALVLGWQMARTPSPALEDADAVIQWLRLPAPAPRIEVPPPAPPKEVLPRVRPVPGRAAGSAPVALPAPPAPADASAPAAPAPEPAADPATETPAMPGAATILENARRSVGSIDRALRKESKPTIVAPPDSPQIRMRERMELARDLAPPRLWEAPKIQELVNNTGDGARRTRVITGNGTYCITERAPTTNIEMIEMHGKIRKTNCPTPEEPAKRQVWRTARD